MIRKFIYTTVIGTILLGTHFVAQSRADQKIPTMVVPVTAPAPGLIDVSLDSTERERRGELNESIKEFLIQRG